MRLINLLIMAVIFSLLFGCTQGASQCSSPLTQQAPGNIPTQGGANNTKQEPSCTPQKGALPKMVYSMKGVGIELPDEDFIQMKKAGIDIISTEWGMEEDISQTRAFLDQAYAAGLRVVMDGGFSYTAWGFTAEDWDKLPKGKRPVWQKAHVQNWIKALKDHPAIYAWDISNEFGENLPSGVAAKNSEWPASRITTEQLKQVKADVLAIDSTRLIHARMYEWDEEILPEHVRNLLENRIADIISLNLYSNYLEDGKLEWPDVIKDVGASRVAGIKKIAPGTAVWLSIAAFEYHGLFQRPTVDSLSRDFEEAANICDLDGISFFCWGPVGQWDPTCKWYLPQTGSDLWEAIQQDIKRSLQGK